MTRHQDPYELIAISHTHSFKFMKKLIRSTSQKFDSKSRDSSVAEPVKTRSSSISSGAVSSSSSTSTRHGRAHSLLSRHTLTEEEIPESQEPSIKSSEYLYPRNSHGQVVIPYHNYDARSEVSIDYDTFVARNPPVKKVKCAVSPNPYPRVPGYPGYGLDESKKEDDDDDQEDAWGWNAMNQRIL